VEKVEEVTRVRFLAADGWENTGERPAGGAQAGWPRCGSTPVVLRSGRGRGWCWAVGELCGTAREALDWATRAREGRCSGAGARTDRRRVLRLCSTAGARAGRCAAFTGGHGSGTPP
jgi:hypothetical protein